MPYLKNKMALISRSYRFQARQYNKVNEPTSYGQGQIQAHCFCKFKNRTSYRVRGVKTPLMEPSFYRSLPPKNTIGKIKIYSPPLAMIKSQHCQSKQSIPDLNDFYCQYQRVKHQKG